MARFVDHITGLRERRAPPSGEPFLEVLTPKTGDTQLITRIPQLGKYCGCYCTIEGISPAANDQLLLRVSTDGRTLDNSASWVLIYENFTSTPAGPNPAQIVGNTGFPVGSTCNAPPSRGYYGSLQIFFPSP